MAATGYYRPQSNDRHGACLGDCYTVLWLLYAWGKTLPGQVFQIHKSHKLLCGAAGTCQRDSTYNLPLFGNIFAGTIVLAIFALLLPVIGGVVFIPFELFVAFLQAFIFALLTLVFLQIATSEEEHKPASVSEAREEFAQNEEKEEKLAGVTD